MTCPVLTKVTALKRWEMFLSTVNVGFRTPDMKGL